MATALTFDIYYDIAKQIRKPGACLDLCRANKNLHEALYPQLIRIDFARLTGRKSLWEALENDDTAQLGRIYAVMYPDFSEYIANQPKEFNFWLQYVAGEGVYGGLNCLRLMLARAAEVGFVPSVDTLSAAVERHNLEAVELLLEYGALLTRQDERDDSVDMVHYLLARGADPLEKYEGLNLLHWHCSQVWTSPLLIETLIEAGVPMDELDQEGRFDEFEETKRRTPLGRACANRFDEPAGYAHSTTTRGQSIWRERGTKGRQVTGCPTTFPYPLESLMEQDIKRFSVAGWGRCLWGHHISLRHEEQDDMGEEVEGRDSVLPLPSILPKSRVSFFATLRSSQGCYEWGRGYFLNDIDSDIHDEIERERQAGSLRFKSWDSQMRRFAHRYFRGVQILLDAGGLELFRTTNHDPADMWLETFHMVLLEAGFCFSPYSGLVRDYFREAPAIHALIEGICQWDFVATTCVAQIDYLLDVMGRGGERGLQSFRLVLDIIADYIIESDHGNILT
ncbi:hypothetical protein CHU98_g9612 [Xylaria longipes]|nr:hypothetical protein CHU98_g9612 [Xylaria longipes]